MWITGALGVAVINEPFTGTATVSVNATDLPNIINTTNPDNTIMQNVTSPSNSTEIGGGSGDTFLFVPDYFEIPFAVLYYFLQFISGGWIWNGIAVFGFPEDVLFGIQVLIGFWAIYTIVYYIIGKG